MAGKAIAAGLVDAAATISPYEDVRGYLQQTLLPVLGPSIEDLLHHVHSSGELQRVLREKAESERRAQRRNSDPDIEATEKRVAVAREGRRQSRDISNTAAANAGDGANQDPPPSSSGRPRRPSISNTGADPASAAAATTAAPGPAAAAPAPESTADEPAFDPLAWLSETLRKSALGDTSQHKETITQRVIQQIKAAEAAEEAERAKAEAEAAEARRAEEGEGGAPEGAEAAS
mmetsp:Transcript_16695/g.29209  ORF Transcript_16695/g.29209 Transcript_16695/m.29209 type:complete len:233 (+) Transcript_16695:63-761(+)